MSTAPMATVVPQLKLIEEDLSEKRDTDVPEYDEKDADWKDVHQKVQSTDSTMLKDYDSEIDTLLVFAGLFSAILTAFIVDVYQDLKVDNGETTSYILQRMLAHMEGRPAPSVQLPPAAHPSAVVMVVVSLWFTSLVLSLLAALFGIFIKQWLHVYSKWIDVSHALTLQQGLTLRGFYQHSLSAWHIPDIFAALGVLLQLALVLFVVGLVGYLWTLNFVVSPIMTVLAFTMIVLSVATIFLPLAYEDCPYKFPMAYLLLKLHSRTAGRDWTEHDLPLARKKLYGDGHAFDTAFAQMALLLDVLPAALRSALEHPTVLVGYEMQPGVPTEDPVKVVAARISQLSPSSTNLLVGLVTAAAVRKAHHDTVKPRTATDEPATKEKAPLQEPPFSLYRLWHLAFRFINDPPLTTVLAMRHLATTLKFDFGDASSEEQHLTLLVNVVLPHCALLNRRGQLPAHELSSVALDIDAWERKGTSRCNSAFAALMCLAALRCAAEAIPINLNATGLSPVTPHLPLLAVLHRRAADVRNLPEEQLQYDLSLIPLLAFVEQLHAELIAHHALYVCTGRRGFTRMEGKTDEARTIFFSHDSAKLLIGTDEPIAWILDVTTLQSTPVTPRLPTAAESNLRFHSAYFARSASVVFWGSREGPVLLVDLNGGNAIEPVLSEFEHGGGRSRVIAISPDEKSIVVDNSTSSATLCDSASGEEITAFMGHTKRICRAAFSPGTVQPLRVATTSFDNTVTIWDVETGDSILTLLDLGTQVNAVAWSHDASVIAVTVSTSVRIYDTTRGELLNTLEGHAKLVAGVTFSPGSKLIATCSDDKTVRVWDGNVSKKAFACLAVLTGPNDEVNDVDFSPDGKFLACAADDSVWIWDINPAAVKRAEDDVAEAPTQTEPDASKNRFRSVVERIMKSRKRGVIENASLLDTPGNSNANSA